MLTCVLSAGLRAGAGASRDQHLSQDVMAQALLSLYTGCLNTF